jgi:hypothetical protein
MTIMNDELGICFLFLDTLPPEFFWKELGKYTNSQDSRFME